MLVAELGTSGIVGVNPGNLEPELGTRPLQTPRCHQRTSLWLRRGLAWARKSPAVWLPEDT